MLKKILLVSLLFFTVCQAGAQHIWTESSDGFDTTYNPSNIIKDSEGILYMIGRTVNIETDEHSSKLFKSDDNGMNWEEIAFMGIENTNAFNTITFADDIMFMGGSENGNIISPNSKIYFSTDKGVNWTVSPMLGFDTNFHIYDIESLNNGNLYLLAGEDVGNEGVAVFEPRLYRSIDQGASWESINVNGLDELGNVYSLTNFGEFMLLGGNIRLEEFIYEGALLISTDQGLNWTALENDWDNNYFPTGFHIDSTGRLYMLANDILLPFSFKFYTSSDMGASWTEVETEGLTDVNLIGDFFVNNDTFIIGAWEGSTSEGAIYTAPKTSIGIDNVSFKDRNLKVYPSLFDENIKVDFGEGDSTAKQIKLFNSVGQEVLQVDNINQQHISIDTQIIPSGIYFLQVIYMNDIRTVKVIK